MHNNNAENWAIFLDHEVSPWYAIYIANIKTPTGKKYFIYPIIPPKNGLKCSPINPEFVYIKTANNMLAIIITATTTFILTCCFF